MKYQPILKNKTLIFKLEKPIFNSVYGVWDKWVKLAQKKELAIQIIVREGTFYFSDINEFLNGAWKTKRFFKNPKIPMIFYLRDYAKKKNEGAPVQLNLFKNV